MFAVGATASFAQTASSAQPAGPGVASRPVTITEDEGVSILENDLVAPPPALEPKLPITFGFENLLSAAIRARLGAPYVFGAVGPDRFDCSGFVWSVFQSAGIYFERASVRTLWTRFAPPPRGEELKFGTLVFFNGLDHVGIVADQYSFYHASRSRGVTRSPFSKYWLERLDGFRRVPLPVSAE
jgi:peptidoglycan endopeptidase LytE